MMGAHSENSPGQLWDQPVYPGNPELKLLLACARTDLAGPVEQRIAELLEVGVDGHRFGELAKYHCVDPLVYLALADLGEGRLSLDFLDRARGRFEENSLHNLGYTRELHRLLALLETAGVRGVPYKGPLLAEQAYGNLLARSFFDLDIAIRTQDQELARDVLFADGYKPTEQRSSREEATYLRVSHEYELRSQDGRFAVELHWRFSSIHHPMGVVPEDLWGELVRRKLMGREVWSFSDEALLCLLAFHGSGHQWMRLDWIVSVAEQVRSHPDLDWALVMRQAKAWRVLRATQVALALAVKLLDAPVPDEIQREVRARRSVRLMERMICRRLERGRGRHPFGEWLVYGVMSREGFGDRWRALCSQIGKLLSNPAPQTTKDPLEAGVSES